MQKIKYSFIIIFAFFLIQVKAQDTLKINEVIKTASRQTAFKNSHEELIDSTLKSQYKNSSIDELLIIQTSSQIKSYGGLGNLSSISLRGSGANHVSINWNGFPVNSGTTGGTDLSLIQTGFFEDIKIIPGASSSLYGSGTFGGAVELNNKSNYEKGISTSIGSELGSFNTEKYFINGNLSNNKFQYKLSVNKIKAKNNFTFYNTYKFDNPLEERLHNKLNSLNIIQNLNLKLSQTNTLESGIWYIIKDKEIPEIAGSFGSGNKMQKDSIFRTYLRWKKVFAKSLLTVSSAFFTEYLQYTDKTNSYDTAYSINSKINANNFAGDISYRYYLSNKLIIDFTGIINNQQISTSNYTENQIFETNYSLISSLKYNISDFDIRFSFRNEFLEDVKYIPLFNFGISKKIFKNKIILKSNISNKFRKATFNEKYWQPGGNINIKHETGNNAEISMKYLFGKNANNHFNITYYCSNIKDMIQWIPENGVWTAVNNREVQINGIETNVNYSLQSGMFKHTFYTSYNFTNSMLTDVYSGKDDFIPQKMIYTPTNTAKLFFTSSYKKITISWSSQYTEKQFTTQENTNNFSLPAYSLSNIYASYHFDIKYFNISFKAKFLNIFNKQYELIKSYPTSGRAFYFGITFTYKNVSHKEKAKSLKIK